MTSRKNVVVKDEGTNPYGTYKDRRSKYIVEKALEEGVSKLCLITSGNAGYSLAKHALPVKIKVVSVVDKDLKPSIKKSLREACSSVIEVDLKDKILKPEEVIALSRENEEEAIWDVTNGYASAYESIIDELKDINFDYIICPVGSGEAYVGLHQGLKRYNSSAKLIGVGVLRNPSLADKLATPWTPYKSKIEEILSEGHSLIRLTEEEVAEAYEKYKREYVSEPSSTVVWKGLEKANINPESKIVVLSSGKGLF